MILKKELIIITALIIIMSLSLVACGSQSIASIKDENLVNHQVSVKGEVISSIKLGSFSGFTLSDNSDEIFVSSDTAYSEGKTLRVTGTLKHNMILGYYIETE